MFLYVELAESQFSRIYQDAINVSIDEELNKLIQFLFFLFVLRNEYI